MIYTLIVLSNHLTVGRHALTMAQEIIAKKNTINSIYFLFDGVAVANKFINMPSDEFDLTTEWHTFATQHNITLEVCNASCMRRGINATNLAPGFALSSIGKLVENCAAATKVLTL